MGVLAGWLAAMPAGALPCAATTWRIEALAPGLWWVPAAPGDASAANRGQVSNLLLAADGPRLWLLGSGPTPAFGRALACQVRQQLGRAVTDVVSPWPRPDAVLGVAGLGAVRHWAHADVALAMRQRCPQCVSRLRTMLGEAAVDLGPAPIRVAARRLHGDQGRLGPWRWWRLDRGPGFPVTVWQFRDQPLRFAPGLLWGDGAPDGRDAEIAALTRATQALAELPAAGPGALQWLGTQGGLLAADAPQTHAAYWLQLQADVMTALERGGLETDVAPALLFDAAAPDTRHALNWQRAWRQAEALWLQRSLR